MSHVNLKDIDLNLLVALEVLLEECNVTNSAVRLDVSQPTMSRTLARLRETFSDPLLVRVAKGYERTARADELLGTLRSALSEVRRTFAEQIFDPATATGLFRISSLDYPEVAILPKLMRAVRFEAPGLQIVVVQKSIQSIEEIVDGKADLSIGLMPSSLPKHCFVQKLYEDDYVCVMHRSHPLANSKLTLDGYLSYPHSIIDTGKTPGSFLDDVLAQRGLSREIVKRSPHFVASLLSIGETDLLQTAPRRLAAPLLKSADLVMRDLPFEMKPVVLSQLWHARNNRSPVHRWFREQIVLAAQCIQHNL